MCVWVQGFGGAFTLQLKILQASVFVVDISNRGVYIPGLSTKLVEGDETVCLPLCVRV